LKSEKAELETQLEAESESKAEDIAHQQQQHAEENEQQRIRFSKLETQLKAESKSKAEEITHQQQLQHAEESREWEARNNEGVVQDNRWKTAVTTSTADILFHHHPLHHPCIAAVSANANTSANTIPIQDSFRVQGKDNTRFTTLSSMGKWNMFTIGNKNGRNPVNCTGIAAMMNRERQTVMSHFYKSGRQQESKKRYIEKESAMK